MKITLPQSVRLLDNDLETVISLFLNRVGGRPGILLESAEVDGRWGRYSLAAGDFLFLAACRGGRLDLTVNDPRLEPLRRFQGLDYLEGLRAVMAAVELVPDPARPGFPPITRALYGHLGYEAAGLMEKQLTRALPPERAEGVFGLPGNVYLFDHTYNQLARLTLAEDPDAPMTPPDAAPGPVSPAAPGPVSASFDRAGYLKAAGEIKALIGLGQIVEAALSVQFSAAFEGELFEVYRRLRRLSPSPYMFFLRQPGLSLAASSPEVLITCDRGRLRLCPVAGSRPRGQSLSEDSLFEEELHSDPQEQAEHALLVDLGRHDLGRVAVPGTVKVDRLMEVERFSHAMHLTSRLSAQLAKGRDAVDIMTATFPSGSLSGTPKVRAMEILAEKEGAPRGPYGGALGWLGLDKDEISLDLGLTNRSFWSRDGRVFWQAGARLVQGSVPESQWRECLGKGREIWPALEPGRPLELAAETGAGPEVPDGCLSPRPGAGPELPPPPAPRPAAFEGTPLRLPVLMDRVASGVDLEREMAAQLFTRLMDGELNPSQAGALLMGLRAKGETAVEMAEAATAVLERAVPLPPLPGPVLDVVGTGGDGRNSFNCSTATALTLAGLGYKVVKHGNRSISSRSGSADVLELLGVDLNSPPEDVPAALEKRNFAFLFAPNYHPSFRHIMPVRKELGIRTLFNILGPLVNPAKPAHSFLGAHDQAAAKLLAGALARMDTTFSASVHGAGGYDEMTTLGPATVYLVAGTEVTEMRVDPAKYGFAPARPEELAISGPDEGVAVLRELLAGRGPEPMRDMLTLNVAMALYVRRAAESFDDCLTEARRAVADGVGSTVLPEGGC